MSILENVVNFLNGWLWEKNILVILLISCGIFFSWKTKFVQLRFLKHMIELLLEKKEQENNKISSFQAFCISTATRVGAGNLIGVVSAVSIGGPGAVFWMWIVAILGASTAFIETTVVMLHRERDSKGNFRGGPAFVLEKGLGKRKLGVAFVISGLICWAGVLQIVSNSVTESFNVAFGINVYIMAGVLVFLSGIVIFGRREKIAKVLDKIVPFMAVLYISVVFFIIVKNITLLPSVLQEIVSHAFGIRQGVGGAIGAIIMQGVKRGLFSNEAGTGSAPCAAATADVSHPVKQGLIQSLGVFLDTLVICTATAMVVLLTDSKFLTGAQGMELLQRAFTVHIGGVGNIFIASVLFLFSFSTILGICFYAKENIAFITSKIWADNLFKIFALLMIFFGGISQNIFMWNLADLGLGLMTIVNMMGILPLTGLALGALKDYEHKLSVLKNKITI